MSNKIENRFHDCCDESELVSVFTKNVVEHDNAFVLTHKGQILHFTQSRLHSNYKMIYGHKDFSEVFLHESTQKMTLVAIVTNQVYILDTYMLEIKYGREDNLPDSVEVLKAETYNNRVRKEFFPAFYESIDIKEVPDYEKNELRAEARRYALKNKEYSVKYDDLLFSHQDAVAIVCGVLDFKSEVTKRLEKEKEIWEAAKAREAYINKLRCDGGLVQDWEIRLANALNNTDAKKVSAEFTVNGRTASAKINPVQIFLLLVNEEQFRWFRFDSRKEGNELFDFLFDVTYADGRELKCEHISKITYGKKVLFKKEEDSKDAE